MEYISDALGFRVAATNLPAHVIGEEEAPPAAVEPAPAAVLPATDVAPPAVVAVKSAPVAPVAPVAPATVITPKVQSYVHLPYAVGYRYLLAPGSFAVPAAAPVVPVAEAKAAEEAPDAVGAPAVVVPAVSPAVVVPDTVAPSSQFQAQDEAGQYNYGYSSQLSSKQETKAADGVVRGSYSYVDANGVVQKVDYISDVLGFRVVGTNVPGASPSAPLIAPKVVQYAYLPYAFNHPYYNYVQKF